MKTMTELADEIERMEKLATKGPLAANARRSESRDEHGIVNEGWIIAEYEGPQAYENLALDVLLRNSAPVLVEALRMCETARELLSEALKSVPFESPVRISPSFVNYKEARARLDAKMGEMSK